MPDFAALAQTLARGQQLCHPHWDSSGCDEGCNAKTASSEHEHNLKLFEMWFQAFFKGFSMPDIVDLAQTKACEQHNCRSHGCWTAVKRTAVLRLPVWKMVQLKSNLKWHFKAFSQGSPCLMSPIWHKTRQVSDSFVTHPDPWVVVVNAAVPPHLVLKVKIVVKSFKIAFQSCCAGFFKLNVANLAQNTACEQRLCPSHGCWVVVMDTDVLRLPFLI